MNASRMLLRDALYMCFLKFDAGQCSDVVAGAARRDQQLTRKSLTLGAGPEGGKLLFVSGVWNSWAMIEARRLLRFFFYKSILLLILYVHINLLVLL